ncbi:MAG: Hsp20/alpha crystallin family protein [Candidatus Uhrbacteria bacterium]|nr:Hsp20/alpha crystallin family protein [Candidatus Uhrbacteria bacterium]
MKQETPIEDWPLTSGDGRLSVDVFCDGDCLVLRSTIAGAQIEDVDISIDGDLLTIRGERHIKEQLTEDDWFYQECYWGPFSRSLILPVDVHAERAEATLEDGILTVRLPLRAATHRLPIKNISSRM